MSVLQGAVLYTQLPSYYGCSMEQYVRDGGRHAIIIERQLARCHHCYLLCHTVVTSFMYMSQAMPCGFTT